MFAEHRALQVNPQYVWDDVVLNEKLRSGDIQVTEDDIMQFALAFDPLPIHVDHEAARRSRYGGLTGSGSHMFAIRQRLLYDFDFPGAVIVSLGVDNMRYVQPLRPGQTCRVEVEFTSKRLSRSNDRQGIVTLKTELLADDVVVLSLLETVLMRRA